MPFTERERWNSKYLQGSHPGSEPDAFFAQAFSKFVQPAFPAAGTALDLAGGAGRHAIYLAQRGWQVTLTDISEVAIEKARTNAGSLASHIQFVIDDLTQFQAAQTQFDLVLVFFYLRRESFPEIVKSISPGGLLLYKTHLRDLSGAAKGPKSPHHTVESKELPRLAAGLEVLHYEEIVSDRPTAMLAARKALHSPPTA